MSGADSVSVSIDRREGVGRRERGGGRVIMTSNLRDKRVPEEETVIKRRTRALWVGWGWGGLGVI